MKTDEPSAARTRPALATARRARPCRRAGPVRRIRTALPTGTGLREAVRLQPEHLGVGPAGGYQPAVGSEFRDPPAVEHGDASARRTVENRCEMTIVVTPDVS